MAKWRSTEIPSLYLALRHFGHENLHVALNHARYSPFLNGRTLAELNQRLQRDQQSMLNGPQDPLKYAAMTRKWWKPNELSSLFLGMRHHGRDFAAIKNDHRFRDFLLGRNVSACKAKLRREELKIENSYFRTLHLNGMMAGGQNINANGNANLIAQMQELLNNQNEHLAQRQHELLVSIEQRLDNQTLTLSNLVNQRFNEIMDRLDNP